VTWKYYVILGIAIATAILLVVEIVALANKTPGDTISEIVRSASREWPLIPFILGAIMAHFFWTN
jgi:hypothetical protein